MKKLISLIVGFLVTIPLVLSQKMPVLQQGMVLTYDVSAENLNYEFKVTLLQLDKTIKFKWIMTDPVNMEGTTTLTDNALKNATVYSNFFSSGDVVLDQQSTVFISEKNYKQIKSRKSTQMDMGENINGNWSGGKDSFTILYKGNEVYPQAYYLAPENKPDNTPYYDVVALAEGKYHLILSMTLWFSIRLISIE